MSTIKTQDEQAAQQTIDDTGIAKSAARHEAGIADERQRANAAQAAGVSATEAALEGASRDVRQRETDRERTLTGTLGKK